ncbi:MAG: M4 family metallopeptidase [Coriobacteriales bacterium]|nr:M4 family metallopeptidase [Coriobacteriales bacterium]
MRRLTVLLCTAVSIVLAATLVACGGNANSPADNASSESASTSSGPTEEEQAVHMQAITGEGIVNTFIAEKFCDHKVTNEEEAEACVKEMIGRIGGNETTELELTSIRPNEDGMTVVTFTQRAGEMMVFGSTVKLVLDKDDNAIALVGSIIPDVQIRDIEEWAVDAAGAEQIVMNQLEAQGASDSLVEGATMRAIVPVPMVKERYVCAWIVFTFQPDSDDDQAYTAHYVFADGEYMYSIPVSGVDDVDALTGSKAKTIFDVDAYEPAEMNVTVQGADGTSKEITVPVLKDAATGKTYLADAKRKILCADYATYTYNNEIKPTEVQDGANPVDANTYYTYTRAWDYYDSVGWTGPDGKGTPSLLLMNYVDESGKPIENANYYKADGGFQVFTFTRDPDFGNCLDVLGHEFTHCVTGTTMTANIYTNDAGAINEGMSDVMGNIIERRLDGDAGAWTIAEGIGKIGRNMADPHECAQPEFAFDTYYAPHPPVATGINDMGGVHTNSSLLNIVSYKLDKAGMTLKDQSYFWLNVALILSPQTDYPMLAEMLPWVMEQLGYSQYVDALKAAIEEAKFTATEDPGTTAGGCGSVTFDFVDVKEAVDSGQVCIGFYKAPDADSFMRADTWPVAGTTVAKANLPAGDYYVVASVGGGAGNIDNITKCMVLSESGWTYIGENPKDSKAIKAAGKTVTVEAGKSLEIPNDSFGPVATQQLKVIEKTLVERAGGEGVEG